MVTSAKRLTGFENIGSIAVFVWAKAVVASVRQAEARVTSIVAELNAGPGTRSSGARIGAVACKPIMASNSNTPTRMRGNRLKRSVIAAS